ncbi:cohesin domain-containing protein [Patescibacteria group bacterium]|nr:cohesin domain-containing protein [Patescibacteria group bacterium]MBU1683275.1 cohesin domain-containing protein [Patescibacteria group bacterium]MBU1935068.1 cohesin domain-containing protein [Patescibacteria group bacterium]
MKTSRILIAAAIIILLSSFLSGCIQRSSEEISVHNAAVRSLQAVQDVTKEVDLVLVADREGDQVTVKVMLDNPEEKPITSVQSWLSYNPKALEGKSVDFSNSDFVLSAPYENTFDEFFGLVMIGRGTNEAVVAKSITVAEVVFDLIADGTTMVDIYDYQTNLTGHASVNMILDGFPYNILKKPESPALIIQNSKLEN